MEAKEIQIQKLRPIKKNNLHTYNHLTVLVVAKSDSMCQNHVSDISKGEITEKAIDILLEHMKHNRKAINLSFARINYGESIEVALLPTPVKNIVREKIYSYVRKGEPRIADALETARYFAAAYKQLNGVEGGLPYFASVFLITDGHDIEKERTIGVVKELNKETNIFFIFHIPSEDNPKEGYDYFVSLGHTHSLFDAELITVPFYLDDIPCSEYDNYYTGFELL